LNLYRNEGKGFSRAELRWEKGGGGKLLKSVFLEKRIPGSGPMVCRQTGGGGGGRFCESGQ